MSDRLLHFLSLYLIWAALGAPIVLGLLRLVVTNLRHGRRQSRVAAELDRPARAGARHVVYWDQLAKLPKQDIVGMAEIRGWRYLGQEVTTAGWELRFERARSSAEVAARRRRGRADPLAAEALLVDELRAAHPDDSGAYRLDLARYRNALTVGMICRFAASAGWLVRSPEPGVDVLTLQRPPIRYGRHPVSDE